MKIWKTIIHLNTLFQPHLQTFSSSYPILCLFPQFEFAELVVKYAEVVRSLVHRNIDKFGHLYAHLCPHPIQMLGEMDCL